MHTNNSSIAVKSSGFSTRLRQLALAIVGAAVFGAGANAAAPADAQAYTSSWYIQPRADYHITAATLKSGSLAFTLRNSGATTDKYSWISVRDPQGRVIAWYGKTGMAGGTEYRDGGYFPQAARVCADDWQNAIVEYNESNNCTQVSPWLN